MFDELFGVPPQSELAQSYRQIRDIESQLFPVQPKPDDPRASAIADNASRELGFTPNFRNRSQRMMMRDLEGNQAGGMYDMGDTPGMAYPRTRIHPNTGPSTVAHELLHDVYSEKDDEEIAAFKEMLRTLSPEQVQEVKRGLQAWEGQYPTQKLDRTTPTLDDLPPAFLNEVHSNLPEFTGGQLSQELRNYYSQYFSDPDMESPGIPQETLDMFEGVGLLPSRARPFKNIANVFSNYRENVDSRGRGEAREWMFPDY